MYNLRTFASRPALYAAAAERIAEWLRAGIAARGQACAALSGGTTPEPAYALLAEQAIDWSKVTFALVDERFVAPEHPASNEALLRRALAKPLRKGARVAAMYGAGTPAQAALRADDAYAALHFDIVLLGMGVDGHTASWFPGAAGLSDALDSHCARSVVALRAPGAPGSADRLSLTLAAIVRAERVALLITGAEKLTALEAGASQAPVAVPVAALLGGVAPKLEVLWAA